MISINLFSPKEHSKAACVYAHNVQDFRRNPQIVKYENTQCPNWRTEDIQTYKDGGCPDMRDCNHCHGWREVEYHPDNYKTKMCGIGSQGPNKHYCQFFHNENERVYTKKGKQDQHYKK